MQNTDQNLSAIMPVLFVGHGNPMNAIEDNEFTRQWQRYAQLIQRPKAILCISAHWLTNGTFVTAMSKPRTIHDFGGFPKELFNTQYNAPGSPEIAENISRIMSAYSVKSDLDWGLDHGCWSVLIKMFPEAEIPVIQLSIDYSKSLRQHYDMAKTLTILRKENILIMGSGNIVHNLSLIRFEDFAYDWAIEFDDWIGECIKNRDEEAILNFSLKKGISQLAVPTTEHFIPLLYVLGCTERNEPMEFFNSKIAMGSLSMRSLKVG